jgi:hypothetical protein
MSVLDARDAERSGVGSSVIARLWETECPLNVNDSDLTVNMAVHPLNHVGVIQSLSSSVLSFSAKIPSNENHNNSSDICAA